MGRPVSQPAAEPDQERTNRVERLMQNLSFAIIPLIG